jgi:hypothetical protein
MITRRRILFSIVAATGLLGAASTHAIGRADYAASVMEILRMHVHLLEELAVTDRFKYSDNVVRHATAIERAFGLLGPMEWHAAESARLHSKHLGDDAELDEHEFEDLAWASRKALKGLVRAAHDSMEEYDRDGILNAVNEMKQTCENCHSLLPELVAHDVWGLSDRK